MNTEVPSNSSESGLVRAKTFAGAVWLVSWRMVTRIIGLGSTLVLARVLVPADFGLIAMATAFSASVDAISVLGLQDALVRRRSEDKALHDTAFTLQLLRSILTSAVLLAFAPLVAAWFKEPRLISVLVVLAGASLISGFENIGVVETRRALRFDVQFKLLLWPRLFQVAVTVALAFTLRSYWALLWGIVASKVAKTLFTYRFCPHWPRFQVSGWRELAGFSFWTWATALASLLWDRSTPFILGPTFGAANLGLYLMAAETASLPVTEIVCPASSAILTGFAVAQKEGTSSLHLGPKVAATMTLLLLPIIATISAASGDIVEVLFGPKWNAAQPLVAILAWLCLMSPFSYSCSTAMVANGLVRHNFIANLAISLIKVVVLVTVVTVSSNLLVVAAAETALVAAESLIFMALFKYASGIGFGNVRMGVVRILAAGVMSLGILWATKLGWHAAQAGPALALLRGLLIGVTATASYSAALFLLWHASGRPDGPERWAAELLLPKIRKMVFR